MNFDRKKILYPFQEDWALLEFKKPNANRVKTDWAHALDRTMG